MNANISKHELQEIRDIIWQGRAYYSKGVIGYDRNRYVPIGTKLIKKINSMLKSVHGHDCNGQNYL